jgi:hypothetical protein
MGVIAQADTLLGQLQRGRGRGFVRALREDASVVRPLLVDCVTHDPRWDRQLEERSDYYAALIMHTAMPLDPFDAYLHALSGTAAGDPHALVLDTMCALATRGHTPAIAIVRDYLDYGECWECWERAFEALANTQGNPISMDEVSRVINQRFPDDDTLDDELASVGPGMHTQQEPWRSLCKVNHRVERILSEHEAKAEQRQRKAEQRQRRQNQIQNQMKATLAGLSTPELLAGANQSNYRLAAMALEKRVVGTDLDHLLDVAQRGDRWQRFVAFRGLQRLAHPAALPVPRALFESSGTRLGPAYGAAVAAITALPTDVTLDLARMWLDAPDSRQRHIALEILEAHGTVADVPRVRDALIPSLHRDTGHTNECYMQCSMLEILARFPEAGPYPEVETVFREAGYSRTRIYAAEVLAASDSQGFARGLAVECLWDCEVRVRLIGCDSVDLEMPDVRARLHAMSSDPYEDEDVSSAARERLADVQPPIEHDHGAASEID